MKTRKVSLVLLAIAIVLVSCKSTYNPKYSKDALANIDPFEMGVAVANVNKLLAYDIDQKNLTVSLEPRMNRVIVGYSYQFNDVDLYLDAADRAKIIDAIALYGESFDAKTLDKRKNNTGVYGVVKADIKWGVKYGNKGEATPSVKLGYRFIDGSPYFVITMPETVNALYGKSLSGSGIKNSAFMVLCFNRVQATIFAEFLSEDRIRKEIEAQNVPANLEVNPEKDINAPDVY